MPVLKNPKHERFCQELAKGKTADESYVLAGYKENRGNAATLKANQSIADRLIELQSAIAERAIEETALSKEWVISRLVENVERALQVVAVKDNKGIETGEYKYEGNVANRALELLGKELGLFVDRKEVGKPGDFDRMSENDLDAKLEALIAGRKDRAGASADGQRAAQGQAGVRGKPSGLH